MYLDFNVGEKTYKLRLTTRNIVALEKVIKCNPLAIFGNNEEIPEVSTMVAILWQSLQTFQHGIGLDETYSIFDEYLIKNSMTDFISVILDIYRVSGIIKDGSKGEDEKNVIAEGN